MERLGSPRARVVLAVLATLGWLGGCGEGNVAPCAECAPAALVVSDPVDAATLPMLAHAVPSAVHAPEDSVVFVSLPAGSAPTGHRAFVHRVGGAATLATAVEDGGFDPVPIEAQAGDSIEVVITDLSGAAIVVLGLKVAGRRPPIIIRTRPPRDKTDVPVNASIIIVFSEPINPSSLTAASVQLLRGTTAVSGTFSLLDGAGTVGSPGTELEFAL